MENQLQPNPDKTGLNPAKLREAENLLHEGHSRGLYPGGVLWTSLGGVTVSLCCVGHTDFSRNISVDEDTLFDLASLTKPMATAPAILSLIANGLISLDQKIKESFPSRDLRHLKDVTIFHLLTHTSGLPAWRDLYSDGITRGQAADKLFQIVPNNKPGAVYEYSCLGYIMLALVVEAVSGTPFDDFVQTRIFAPLGMSETTFRPNPNKTIASTGCCPSRRRELRGEVHDLNAFAFGGISGNAGLFSTMRDMARFCHSITNKSHFDPLLPAALADSNIKFTNVLNHQVGGHTLGGWCIWPNNMLPVGETVIKTIVGHTGFTGTAVIIEPEHSLCSAFLTNRVCNPDVGNEFRTLRREVFDALHGAFLW